MAKRGRPRERSGEETRERILEAALELFKRKGYAATSTAEIARAAGLSAGALFWHFEGKEALFAASSQREIESLRQIMAGFAADPNEPFEAELCRLTLNFLRHLYDHSDGLAFLIGESVRFPEHGELFLKEFLLPFRELFQAYLERRKGQGVAGEVKAEMAARFFLSSLGFFLLTQRVFGGERLMPIALEEAATGYTHLFIHGIGEK